MVRLIVGEKGKGKTKYLLDQVNNDVNKFSGSVVYLDKSNKHMHELSNKVRLINVKEYSLKNADEFIGFILGLLAGNYDIEEIFFDSYLKISHQEDCDLTENLNELERISKQFNINFTLSVSCGKDQIPEKFHESIVVCL